MMRILLAVLLVSCVPSPPRPVAPATTPPSQPPQAHVVSAASGDRTARAYDAIAHALQVLDHTAAADSKHLYLAAHLAGTTAHLAASTVRRIERARRAGTWTAGLHYQVAGGAVLDDNQLVTNLIAMQGRALARQRDLHARLFAAYRADFPRANGLQLAELNRLGPPAKVAVIAVPGSRGRHHHKKTRVSCWIWSKRKAFLATCWTPEGTIAMRDQWKKTGQVAARGHRARPAPAAAAAAPADESTAAVETSIDTSDIPSSDGASDSAASDMASADDATAAASADTSDASDAAASTSATDSNDSETSDSSDSSSSDSASSDSSSGDSSSGDSSSGDSSSGDSSSGDSSASAPDQPAQPACLPDGAETDDWNKCCGGHWSHHTGEDGHTCCSEIGGDCS